MSNLLLDVCLDVFSLICSQLRPEEIFLLSKTCRSIRSKIECLNLLSNKRVRIECKMILLEFGRTISLTKLQAAQSRRRAIARDSVEFSYSQFKKSLRWFHICPMKVIIKCRQLTTCITDCLPVEAFNSSLYFPSGVLAINMNKCDLSTDQMREFIERFKPFSLHLYGLFDRTIVNDRMIPDCVEDLVVTASKSNSTNVSFTVKTISDIVERWQRGSENYVRKDFVDIFHPNKERERTIILPNCDVDRDDIFSLHKLLIRPSPSGYQERKVKIYSFPTTSIDDRLADDLNDVEHDLGNDMLIMNISSENRNLSDEVSTWTFSSRVTDHADTVVKTEISFYRRPWEVVTVYPAVQLVDIHL